MGEKEIIHRDLIGSPGYVKRVMMNILSNAVKYNRENGHIYISCMEIPSEQPEMTTMEFVCRDTGIGMTEEFQKYIFEPFAQEHTGSRTKFAGTGLGMPISKKLVEKMGGTITFESEKGVGTTFVIRVPFKIDLDADKREEQKDVSEKSIKGLHILLAEDNELNMEITEFMLQNEENRDILKEILGDTYNYLEAENGNQAIQMIGENIGIDLMLLDINMPQMNGFEVLEIMKRSQCIAETPVIMISSEDAVDTMRKAYELGITDYITRPFDSVIVKKRVQNTLGLYMNQKHLINVVYDQVYEKEENNNIMIRIMSNILGSRNSESREHILHIKKQQRR